MSFAKRPLPVWANFQQRALDVAILEINTKTDLKIKLASTERSKHRRVVALNFLIGTGAKIAIAPLVSLPLCGRTLAGKSRDRR
jgi:hypothetical protein